MAVRQDCGTRQEPSKRLKRISLPGPCIDRSNRERVADGRTGEMDARRMESDSQKKRLPKPADAGAYAVGRSESENSSSESHPKQIDQTAMISSRDGLPAEQLRPARLPGDTFGRYRIRRILGEGAMGAVYLALDTQLHRKVALKIPKVNSSDDDKFIVRFLREARAAATLSHPNICPIFDVGEIDETHFIAMAYVQGQPLSEFVNPDKPQRDRSVAVVVRKVALALYDAHVNGLIHRDVKPANIMIDQRNEPIIMDFGLARHVDDNDDARLTTEGAILGSPAYMSPEQIEGRIDKIGPACDIYSLGVILYELLTGELPYQGSVASIIAQIVTKDPPDPRDIRPDISPILSAVCLKAMAKAIDDRFASMKALADELTVFLKSRDNKKRTGLAGVKEDTDSLEPTAKPIEVTCKCGQRLVAKRHLAGKMVKCPRCGELRTLPGVDADSTQQLDVSCDACGQRFLASSGLAGRVVRCSTCGQPISVPRPGGSRPQSQIAVKCQCGKQFMAKRELAGKRVKCPACACALQIPLS